MTPTNLATSQNMTISWQAYYPAIPQEINLNIFNNLQLNDLLNCRKVCQQWNSFVKDLISNDPWHSEINLKKELYTSHSFGGYSSSTNPFILSADETRLFCLYQGSLIRGWDVQTQEYLQLEGHTQEVTSLALSPDQQTLFSGSKDRTIKIWNIQNETCLATLDSHNASITSLALSSDGKMLFSVDLNHQIKIWDVVTRKCLHILQDHAQMMDSLVLSSSEKNLYSSSLHHRTITVWDIASGNRLQAFKAEHKVNNATKIKILDIDTGGCLKTLQSENHLITFFNLSPDGKKIFATYTNKQIKILDVLTGNCLHTLDGLKGQARSFKLSTDEKKLLARSDVESKIWDIETGNCLHTISSQTMIHSFALSHTFALSHDGKKLFFHSNDGGIKLWNYGASLTEILKNIADLLKKNNKDSIEEGLHLFEKMPPTEKNAIYEEIYSIYNPFKNDYPNCAQDAFQKSTPQQKAQAIENYLQRIKPTIPSTVS